MNSEYKTLAGIVLFNPEIQRLKQNIDSIRNQVDEVVLVDNNSNNFEEIEKAVNLEDIHIIRNFRNEGIARALNQLFEYANNNGVEWILTLDQDSICKEQLVNEYKRFIGSDSRTDREKSIGIIPCEITDRNFFSSELKATKDGKHTEVEKCITSGSFCSVTAYKHDRV